MKTPKTILAILAALAMAIYIPSVSLAQNSQSGQVPQPQGGVATVIGVDEPDNCLRIRSGPGNSYDVVGCAAIGEQLNITGVWASNDWAQLANNGWVYGPQIQTDLQPPAAAFSRGGDYAAVEDAYPDYYASYLDTYLPGYGYYTYWNGGIPLFVYDVNVWRRHHPWWVHRNWNRQHGVWDRSRGFRQNVRTVTPRNFVTNRSNFSSSNVLRFNANRFRSGSSNMIRSGRTFSSPNTFRAFSNPNTLRSFSRSNTLRLGSVGTRNFARSFNSARIGGFSAARMGSGVHIGSSGAHFRGGGRHR